MFLLLRYAPLLPGMHCNYCRGRAKRLGDMAYQRGREKEEAQKVLTCLYSIMNSSFHNAVYCCMHAGLLYCTVVSDEETTKRAANSHLFSVDMYGPRGWTFFFIFHFPLCHVTIRSGQSRSVSVTRRAGCFCLPPPPPQLRVQSTPLPRASPPPKPLHPLGRAFEKEERERKECLPSRKVPITA